MKTKKLFLANESIAFQSGELFNDLIDCIENTYSTDPYLYQKVGFNIVEILNIAKTINKHTGIKIELQNGPPSVRFPRIANNNILLNNFEREFFKMYNVDMQKDIRPFLANMDTKLIDGFIDLNKSRVAGVFSEMIFIMNIPAIMLSSNKLFNSRETAALILHELGHIFTFMEYLSRSVFTNQVLASLVKTLDKNVSDDIRQIIFTKTQKILRLTDEQKETLNKAKDKYTMTLVVVDASVEKSISELGVSIYDSVSSEFLADQFASRHKAGKDLVIALDKLNKIYESENSAIFIQAGKVIDFIFLSVFTLGIYVLILPFTPSKEKALYDNDKSRIDRIKMQNIERLKDKTLSNELKLEILEVNFLIDNILRQYKDNLTFVEKLAYFIRPNYRNAHKYEMLQKSIEQLANNQLFNSAAKLTTI